MTSRRKNQANEFMTLRVYLISTASLQSGLQQFLSDRALTWDRGGFAGDAEDLVEAAGRICYLSFGARQFRKSNAEYIDNLIAQGHESVLEHANFTLLIDGISRSLSHQLVRHRIGFAYSQLSQQYKDELDAHFVEPPGLEGNPDALNRWRWFMQEARTLYGELLNASYSTDVGSSKRERHRWIRNIARSVLPNATTTTLMITGNARAWRHLLDVRGNIEGDHEMREYCAEVFRTLSAVAPSLFADYELVSDVLGVAVRKPSRTDR
jgi:thymidylate synthase (FAD)